MDAIGLRTQKKFTEDIEILKDNLLPSYLIRSHATHSQTFAGRQLETVLQSHESDKDAEPLSFGYPGLHLILCRALLSDAHPECLRLAY